MNDVVDPANVQPEAEVSTENDGIMGAIESHSDLVKFDVEAMDSEATPEAAEEETEPADSEEPAETEETEAAEEETDETEEPEESEDEPEEAEDVEDGEISLEEMKKGQGYINKKIGKAHKARKQAEGEAEKLRGELESAREQLLQAQQVDPVAALESVGLDASLVKPPHELQSEYQRLNQLNRQLKVAATNPDGLEEGGKHYTQQDVMREQFAVEERLEQVRHAFGVAQQRVAAESEIKKVYPELYDTHSEQAVSFAQALNTVPGLHALPSAGAAVGDMLVGRKVREALGVENGSVFAQLEKLLSGRLTVGKVAKPKPKAKAKAAEVAPAVKPKAKAVQAKAAEKAFDEEAFSKNPTRETLKKLDAQMMN